MVKLIQKRSKQLYEMDVVLFDRNDLPVLIPTVIIESLKTLSKKTTSPTKKKGGGAQAAAAQAERTDAQEGSPSIRLSLDKAGTGKSANSGTTPQSRKSRFGAGMRTGLSSMILAVPPRPQMTQAQIDRRLQYLLLENDDQKKDIYNGLQRIQSLMSHDALYINKAEEIKKKQHNEDLLQTQLSNEQQKPVISPPAKPESKGTLVNIPVVIKNVEMLNYVMRIGERMPTFNFWPRGREIIHRLIMKAAMSDSMEDFRLYRTDESAIESIIY